MIATLLQKRQVLMTRLEDNLTLIEVSLTSLGSSHHRLLSHLRQIKMINRSGERSHEIKAWVLCLNPHLRISSFNSSHFTSLNRTRCHQRAQRHGTHTVQAEVCQLITRINSNNLSSRLEHRVGDKACLRRRSKTLITCTVLCPSCRSTVNG